MNIDVAIRIFSAFLNSSWKTVDQLLQDRSYTSNDDSRNDWLQANWELLVERKVLPANEFLEIYGEGADYNGASSRIVDPEKTPTYQITIKSRDGHAVFDLLSEQRVIVEGLNFEKLVGFRKNFYIMEPDFNYLLLWDDTQAKESVVSLEDVVIDLIKIV